MVADEETEKGLKHDNEGGPPSLLWTFRTARRRGWFLKVLLGRRVGIGGEQVRSLMKTPQGSSV